MTRSLPLIAAISAAMLTLAPAGFAADEINVSNGLTLTGHPLGLHGTDPVSMFQADAPMLGEATFTATHEGVDYYFASEETRTRFEADPEAMLPQFGGFCAFAIGVGKKLDGDVRYADIVDGKLYLFVNAAIFAKYQDDKAGVIAAAYARWPEIVNTPVADL